MLCKLASTDQQVYVDGRTVVPSAAGAAQPLLVGVVTEDADGFDGLSNFLSGGANARGTQGIKLTLSGYHPAVLVDNSGAGNATIANGTFLHSSTASPGRVQGVAASVAGALVGFASLPAAGLGSSLTGGALAAATQTVTIAGVPATNDAISVTLQVPYQDVVTGTVTPGTAQTRTITVTLSAAQAASVTTAAAAVVAAINADPVLSRYYSAANAVGVITVTAVANPFNVSNANGGQYTIYTAGSGSNGLTIAASAVGGSTATAGGGSLAGGTGYYGTIPALVTIL